jgi:hypothetical protein
MTHSELQFTTTQYNTRYLMFNIDLVGIFIALVLLAFNIIINNLNIVVYNYITTRIVTITFLLSASHHYVSFA